MFDLQNMTYEDFLNANTNYKNANQEDYLDALNISVSEENVISFNENEVVMFVEVYTQDDVGKFHTLVESSVSL